jgi:hypothetical protein
MTNSTVAERIDLKAGIHEIVAFRLEGSAKWHVAKWNDRECRYEFFTRHPSQRPTTCIWGRTLPALASEGIPAFTKQTALRRANAGIYWER